MKFILHCTKNPVYVFPEMKLRGRVLNSYIHVSVSDIYFQDLSAFLAAAKFGDQSWEYINHRYMNVEIGRQNMIILFGNYEAPQFHFWEYINGNQTFILDSHRPFICSV